MSLEANILLALLKQTVQQQKEAYILCPCNGHTIMVIVGTAMQALVFFYVYIMQVVVVTELHVRPNWPGLEGFLSSSLTNASSSEPEPSLRTF